MKKRKPFLLLLLFSFLLGLFWNCSWMGDSIGQDDEIIVFADSLDWPYYQDALNSVFGKQIKMPIPEREFILTWVSFKHFENYQKYKNIFILGRLDSNDPVSENVKVLLNEDVVAGVKEGKYFYIPKQNTWAVNQYLLLLVAQSREDMIQKIHDLGDLIYQDFRRFYYARLKEKMFERMEQKELEKYIAAHFPFTLRIQHDYFIADENLEENYVWIRRLYPDRSILVHWQPVSSDFQLTSRWVIDERNRLAKKLFEGDVVVEEETRAYSVEFKRWRAVRLEGTWKNDKYVIGGPFRTLAFIDQATGRIYMIDFYVQAVGKRKKPFLDQLDVIVHTFNVQEQPQSPE